MRTFCKNRRNYRKKNGHLTEETVDNDGMDKDEELEVVVSGSDDEGGTSGAGKRKNSAQSGIRKKVRT